MHNIARSRGLGGAKSGSPSQCFHTASFLAACAWVAMNLGVMFIARMSESLYWML